MFNATAEDMVKISKPEGVEVSLKGVKAATRVVLIYISKWLQGILLFFIYFTKFLSFSSFLFFLFVFLIKISVY